MRRRTPLLLPDKGLFLWWGPLIWFSWVPCLLFGQTLGRVDALTADQGLSFRDVTGIVQDDWGMMWFGTKQGLDRYDGHRFTSFNDDPGNPNFLPGKEILEGSLILRPDSSLWMIADGRLCVLDLRNYRSRTIPVRPGDPCSLQGKAVAIDQGKYGELWIVSQREGQQFLQEYRADSCFALVDTLQTRYQGFVSLATDTLGNVWCSSEVEGLSLYGPQGRKLPAMRPDSFEWYGRQLFFTLSFIDRNNEHFLFPKSRNEVQRFDDRTGTFQTFLPLPSVVYHGLHDSQDDYWFATRDQLFRLEGDGELVDLSPSLRAVLDFSQIRGLYEDRTHILWVATNNGLLKMPVKRELFQTYLQDDQAGWGHAIRGFTEDAAGNVYFICESGGSIYRLPGGHGPAEKLELPGQQLGRFGVLEHVRNLVYQAEGEYLYMANHHLMRVRLADGHLEKLEAMDAFLNPVLPNPLISLSDGRLLMGYELNKLACYDPVADRAEALFPESKRQERSAETKCLFEDSQQKLWIGTVDQGLYCLDRHGAIEAHYTTSSRPLRLWNDHILAIAEDQAGNIWAGTFGGGLHCIRREGDRIDVFQKKDGLCDDNVVGILPYDDHYLWISTYEGLSCFDLQTQQFQNYFAEDGLTHDEFNYTAYFRSCQGAYYFGGLNGVNAFRPEQMLGQELNPPLCLARLLKYDQRRDSLSIRSSGFSQPAKVQLGPHDSYFQLEWMLPNFLKPSNNQYYTWLEGIEEDWTFQGATPFIRYNRLPAGHYTLRIKGADSRGNWSERELAVLIEVKPFFYRTRWFLLLAGASTGLLIFALFQYRLQELLRMERMRVRISSDLHDDVGSLLSGLAMQAEMMELEASPRDKQKLRDLSDLARQILAQMRDLVWSIDARRDRALDLTERMREFAEEVLLPGDFTFEFQVGELPGQKKLPVEVRQHLYLIFKEAINNIVKHSNGNHVVIGIGNEGPYFELSIADNGRSGSNPRQTTGLGLANMRMRAGKIGATLEIDRDTGFEVRLRRKAL